LQILQSDGFFQRSVANQFFIAKFVCFRGSERLMDKITLVIVDDHQIVCQGIKAMLATVSDIHIKDCVKDFRELFTTLKLEPSNIAIINLYNPAQEEVETIKQLSRQFPKVRLLIFAMEADDQFILQTIRSGAKGILTKESSRNDLVEAIYTIRNGYDFYDKSITNIILHSYLKRSPENEKEEEKEKLSTREEEVLTLYGEGYTNKEIADKLFISIRTVESHKNNIMKKINLRTTVDMVKFAIRNNYVDL